MEKLYRFRAPVDGTATLTVQPAGFDPLVSIFDETGTELLAVASKQTFLVPTPLVRQIPVVAGAGYVVRIADLGADETVAFDLRIDVPYVPTEMTLSPSVTNLGALQVHPSAGAKFFRLETLPGANVLVVEVDPGTGATAVAPRVTVLGNGFAPVTATGPAGQKLLFPIDVSGKAGPFDVMIAGDQGSNPVTVKVGQVVLPLTLDLDALPGFAIDLSGNITVPPQAAAGFGTLGGIAFYNHVTEPFGQSTTLSVTGAAATPLLAVYEEIGGQLRLVRWALPAAGTATTQAVLHVNRLHGVAAIPLGFDASAPVTVVVDGPEQTGVGVGMVPDPPPDFPVADDDPTVPPPPPPPPPPIPTRRRRGKVSSTSATWCWRKNGSITSGRRSCLITSSYSGMAITSNRSSRSSRRVS